MTETVRQVFGRPCWLTALGHLVVAVAHLVGLRARVCHRCTRPQNMNRRADEECRRQANREKSSQHQRHARGDISGYLTSFNWKRSSEIAPENVAERGLATDLPSTRPTW